MNLAAWVAIYLVLVALSMALGFFFGFDIGDTVATSDRPRHDSKQFPVDLDALDRPQAGIGED